MAFSNLSTRHWLLVNKEWSGEQALNWEGFPDRGVEGLATQPGGSFEL